MVRKNIPLTTIVNNKTVPENLNLRPNYQISSFSLFRPDFPNRSRRPPRTRRGTCALRRSTSCHRRSSTQRSTPRHSSNREHPEYVLFRNLGMNRQSRLRYLKQILGRKHKQIFRILTMHVLQALQLAI